MNKLLKFLKIYIMKYYKIKQKINKKKKIKKNFQKALDKYKKN